MVVGILHLALDASVEVFLELQPRLPRVNLIGEALDSPLWCVVRLRVFGWRIGGRYLLREWLRHPSDSNLYGLPVGQRNISIDTGCFQRYRRLRMNISLVGWS